MKMVSFKDGKKDGKRTSWNSDKVEENFFDETYLYHENAQKHYEINFKDSKSSRQDDGNLLQDDLVTGMISSMGGAGLVGFLLGGFNTSILNTDFL